MEDTIPWPTPNGLRAYYDRVWYCKQGVHEGKFSEQTAKRLGNGAVCTQTEEFGWFVTDDYMTVGPRPTEIEAYDLYADRIKFINSQRTKGANQNEVH